MLPRREDKIGLCATDSHQCEINKQLKVETLHLTRSHLYGSVRQPASPGLATPRATRRVPGLVGSAPGICIPATCCDSKTEFEEEVATPTWKQSLSHRHSTAYGFQNP